MAMTETNDKPPVVALLEGLVDSLAGSLSYYQSFMGGCDWERRAISIESGGWSVAPADNSTGPLMARCEGLWRVQRSGYVDDMDYDSTDTQCFQACLMLGCGETVALPDPPDRWTVHRFDGRVEADAIRWQPGPGRFHSRPIALPPGLAVAVAEGTLVVFEVAIGGKG